MVLLLVFMQLTRDLFAIAKFLFVFFNLLQYILLVFPISNVLSEHSLLVALQLFIHFISGRL